MMRPGELRKILRAEPFEPLRIDLSDGRSVLVRHPDQAFVAERHLLVGLAKLERCRPLATPRNGDRVVKDWMIINLVQITGIEPERDANGRNRTKGERK